MKTRLIAALLCLCLMPCQSAHAAEEIPPIDFKGLMLGEDMRTAFTKLPDLADEFDRFLLASANSSILLNKSRPSRITLAQCKLLNLSVRFIPATPEDKKVLWSKEKGIHLSEISADQKAALARTRFYSVSATLDRAHYWRVRDALTEKFGPPHTKETQDLQNRMGASFTSEKCQWNFTGAVVSITEREGQIDTSEYRIFCGTLAPQKAITAPADAKDL